jgi:hypothetical protein
MEFNPIRQIEEAIFLLRRQDTRAWLQYLLAAIPFLLALLNLVHDMTAGYLGERCALESLLCVLLFFWSSAWKAKFGGTLLSSMNGPGLPTQQAGFWRAFYLQAIVQTLKLVGFPFAIASILPIAWTSSFFRNATVEASMPGTTLGVVITRSAKRASIVRGNWTGIAILCIITLLVFVNVYIVIGLLPVLVRTFSGFENLFTRRPGSFFSLNIFCIVVAVTWLFIDPLVLSYNVVRCFYAEARTDGRDLLAKLRPVAAIAALLIVLASGSRMFGEEAVSHEQLSKALQKAEESDDYRWLRVRTATGTRPGDSIFRGLAQGIDDVERAIKSWFSSVGKWLRRMLERSQGGSPTDPKAPAAGLDVRLLLYGLGALVLVAAVVFVLRTMKETQAPNLVSSSEGKAPDWNKDSVMASDLPEEEWLRMAREFLAKGEPRLAVRAMYLSNLSYLGAQEFIRIARAKSNSIYERELRLRPRGSEVSGPFAHSNRNFERAWYGFHEVTPEFVDRFEQDVEAIRQHAKA